MPTSAELKENQIRGYYHNTKSKLIDLFVKRGLIPETYHTNKQVKAMKDTDPKYNFLRQINSSPRKVEIRDLETHKVVLYSFIYKAAWVWDKNTGVISMYNLKSTEEQVCNQGVN